jgi:drug/metabolite transporter (DMT)-like permease
MLASAFTFATMSACAHGLKDRCDWRMVIIARSGLAFLFTLIIARVQQAPLVWPGPKTLWMRSIAGSLGMLCAFYTLTHMPISGAMTLQNSYPFWIALLSWPILGIRPSRTVWIALLCGIIGVALIAQTYSDPSAHFDNQEFATVIAILASVLTSIVMFGLHHLAHVHPLAIAVHFAGIATVTCIGYTWLTSWSKPVSWAGAAEPMTLLLLFAVGALATLGQILMTSAFQKGQPDRLSTIALSQSVFALVYDCLIWQHPLSVGLVFGMVLILTPACWLAAHRPRIIPTTASLQVSDGPNL